MSIVPERVDIPIDAARDLIVRVRHDGVYDLFKHASHDQSTHGNWAGSRVASPGTFPAARLARLATTGGFTYDIRTGRLRDRRGFPVSPYKERERTVPHVTEDDDETIVTKTLDAVRQYRRDNADLVRQPGHHIGAWRDPDSGVVYLDVSIVPQSENAARALALQHQQEAYYDIARRRTVRVGKQTGTDRSDPGRPLGRGVRDGTGRVGQGHARGIANVTRAVLGGARTAVLARTPQTVTKHGDHDQDEHGNWADGTHTWNRRDILQGLVGLPLSLSPREGSGPESDVSDEPLIARQNRAREAMYELGYDPDVRGGPKRPEHTTFAPSNVLVREALRGLPPRFRDHFANRHVSRPARFPHELAPGIGGGYGVPGGPIPEGDLNIGRSNESVGLDPVMVMRHELLHAYSYEHPDYADDAQTGFAKLHEVASRDFAPIAAQQAGTMKDVWHFASRGDWSHAWTELADLYLKGVPLPPNVKAYFAPLDKPYHRGTHAMRKRVDDMRFAWDVDDVLVDVEKHAEHDQKSHGNWADGSSEWKYGPRPSFSAGGDFGAHTQRVGKWNAKVTEAVALGDVTPEDAYRNEWMPDSGRVTDWKPLPDTLYHVTTAADTVQRDGLKVRADISDTVTGIGGGTDVLTSFTTSQKVADGIQGGMLELRRVATGETTMQDVLAEAHKWDIARFDGKKDIDALLSGKAWMVGQFGAPPDKEHEWKPVTSEYHWTGGDGVERYTEWERDLTTEERINRTGQAWKQMSAYREIRGGPYDPFFFGDSWMRLAGVPEDQIRVLEFEPAVNGARGEAHNVAEAEIRTVPKAVRLRRVVEKHASHDQAEHGNRDGATVTATPATKPRALPRSLGISRKDMPQIAERDHAEFFAFARDKGVKIEPTTAVLRDLRPAQDEWNPQNVANMPPEALKKPALISRDNYVLDGTHRWLRLLQDEGPTGNIPVLRIDLPAQEALALMRSFPKAGSKDINQLGRTPVVASADGGWEKFATATLTMPEIMALLKHGSHDQDTHGNWADDAVAIQGLIANIPATDLRGFSFKVGKQPRMFGIFGPDVDAGAEHNRGTGEATVFPRALKSSENARNVLTHEVGHHVALTQPDLFRSIMDDPSLTDEMATLRALYRHNGGIGDDESEAFAEGYRLLHTNPAMLRIIAPGVATHLALDLARKIEKHATHDQDDHGNWADDAQGDHGNWATSGTTIDELRHPVPKAQTGKPVEMRAFRATSRSGDDLETNDGRGTFFAPGASPEFGEHIHEARLRFKNPLVVENMEAAAVVLGDKALSAHITQGREDESLGVTGPDDFYFQADRAVAALARAAGHDGIIYTYNDDLNPVQYVAIDPSAIVDHKRVGTYDWRSTTIKHASHDQEDHGNWAHGTGAPADGHDGVHAGSITERVAASRGRAPTVDEDAAGHEPNSVARKFIERGLHGYGVKGPSEPTGASKEEYATYNEAWQKFKAESIWNEQHSENVATAAAEAVMDGIDANEWDAVVQRVAHDHPHAGFGLAAPDQEIRGIQRDWSETAADSHPGVVAFQLAAAKTLGLPKESANAVYRGYMRPGEPAWSRRQSRELLEERIAAHSDAYGLVVRSMYDNTQKELAAEGVKQVTLYRGIALPEDKEPEWVRKNGIGEITQYPLSSWTGEPALAADFARTASAEMGPSVGFVLSATFPAERIVSTARTGVGTLGEYEYVVAGGLTEAKAALVWGAGSGETEPPKIAKHGHHDQSEHGNWVRGTRAPDQPSRKPSKVEPWEPTPTLHAGAPEIGKGYFRLAEFENAHRDDPYETGTAVREDGVPIVTKSGGEITDPMTGRPAQGITWTDDEVERTLQGD